MNEGANVNYRDYEGKSAAMLADEMGHVNTVALLKRSAMDESPRREYTSSPTRIQRIVHWPFS